jgi:hypothetical protein
VLVEVFRGGAARAQICACLAQDPERLQAAFTRFCVREAKLLTLELLLKSPFRLEELARKWVRSLGGAIAGEEEKESTARLARLDFGDVLKNLEAAEKDRETRLARLKEIEAKRLREEQEAYQRAGRE